MLCDIGSFNRSKVLNYDTPFVLFVHCQRYSWNEKKYPPIIFFQQITLETTAEVIKEKNEIKKKSKRIYLLEKIR